MSDILDDLHEAAKQVINHRALGKAVGTILKASEEIKRLRDENERLTRELQAIQSRGADPDPIKG
jgi:hypothetical protein